MSVDQPPPPKFPVMNGSMFVQTWYQWFQNLQRVVESIRVTTYENRVIVKSADDLTDIDSTKLYMIDGLINMGNTSIEVPEDGINIAGLNGGREVMGLYSEADNYTMFTTPSGGYAGNVLMESMTLYVTGTNSKLFDLDNDDNGGSFEFTGMNFGGFGSVYCTSLGDISSYRQFFVANSGFYNVKDGFTMNGTWSGPGRS